MKEYKVKITEMRYEYIEAESVDDALNKAQDMALTNADEVICEVITKDSPQFKDVIDYGKNIKMKNIAGCIEDENWTLDDCEKNCPRYYGCYSVALANDILKEYEDIL